MAVPRLDSTPVIPTLARIEVSAANTAEPIAYRIYVFPLAFWSLFFFFYHQDNANTQQYGTNEFYSQMLGFMEQNDCK